MDIVITFERAVLLASMLVDYEIYWAHVIVEQIHESILQMNTS